MNCIFPLYHKALTEKGAGTELWYQIFTNHLLGPIMLKILTTSVPDRSYRRSNHGTQFNNNDYHRNTTAQTGRQIIHNNSMEATSRQQVHRDQHPDPQHYSDPQQQYYIFLQQGQQLQHASTSCSSGYGECYGIYFLTKLNGS